MILLQILSGKQAGTSWAARRFPVQVGRSPEATLQLEENGVWDEHFTIDFKAREGFLIESMPNAAVAVNAIPVEQTFLRNGDIIDAGGVKLRFWLGETRQAGLDFRDYLTWIAIGLISLGQVGLVYWLLR
jgi:FHA domain-containing protein